MILVVADHGGMTSTDHHSDALIVRRATTADAAALERLAELDSSRLSRGPHLVAEADGDLVAAVSMTSGRVVADPFRPSASAVAVLRARVAHLTGAGRRGRTPALGALTRRLRTT